MNDIIAEVEIFSTQSLNAVAQRLEELIGGISFVPEQTGRFEEVPAFIATDIRSGMEFVLLGIPEGEVSDAYIFEFSIETELPILEFKRIAPEFINRLIVEKDLNSRGYLDYSDELAAALSANGIVASRALP